MVILYVFSFSTVTIAFKFHHHKQPQQAPQRLHEITEPTASDNTVIEEEESTSTSPIQVSLISSISQLTTRHFLDTKHIYKLINNTGVILHASNLQLQLPINTNNQWILLQSSTPPHSNSIDFPISKCLNQQFGDGGSIDVQSTIFASFINTLDLTLGLNILFASESFTMRFELTKSITWRNLYTCIVPDGMVGQMWARSNVVEFDVVELSFIEVVNDASADDGDDDEGANKGADEGVNEDSGEATAVLRKKDKFIRRERRLRGERHKNKKNGWGISKFRSKKDRIKIKFWKKLQKVKMFTGGGGGSNGAGGAIQRRPIISCVTDVRLLDCSGKRTRNLQGLEII
ncbi:hypothetical protein CANMA_002995 [Candida margitis]|uniref:uncharacterized protein n=1 Tax=Candida margitis TaxID=1775924 RepID=UPI002227EA0C|nr:uncharacterized protein CANMA_002995 [Candida margitis]KAI5967561.1 hypothetical protein CANMA_002995 [Candida margitis]